MTSAVGNNQVKRPIQYPLSKHSTMSARHIDEKQALYKHSEQENIMKVSGAPRRFHRCILWEAAAGARLKRSRQWCAVGRRRQREEIREWIIEW